MCLFCFGLFVLRASPQGFLFFSGLFVLRASPQGLLFFFGLFVLRASPQGSRFIHCCLFVLRASPQGLVLSLYSCEFRFSVRFLMFCFRFFSFLPFFAPKMTVSFAAIYMFWLCRLFLGTRRLFEAMLFSSRCRFFVLLSLFSLLFV